MKYLLLSVIIIFADFHYCIAFVSDQIIELPGIKQKPSFRQYSGYLDIGEGRHYHYWFVESQSNPAKDPVLLWLNGGPGCSSLGGFWTENGPFRVNRDGKTLVEDANSWNTLANVLYLESPVGVGNSYSDNTSYNNSDDSTAEDNFLALQTFFDKFPQFSNNSFYITGESYAGVYIPMLALKIYKNNSTINLQGVAIGNGFYDSKVLSKSRWEMRESHGLFEYFHIDGYNIYSDCDTNVFYSSDSPSIRDLKTYLEKDMSDIEPFAQTFSSKVKCLSDGYQTYLNSAEVRKALHVPEHLPKWYQCKLSHYKEQYFTMKNQFKELIEKHKIPKFIVYNGDVDTVCDFLGDQQFVDELGYKLIQKYKSWRAGGRTAGFVKRYEGITFMTVRFSGHMVPMDQPKAALAIIRELIGISNVN